MASSEKRAARKLLTVECKEYNAKQHLYITKTELLGKECWRRIFTRYKIRSNRSRRRTRTPSSKCFAMQSRRISARKKRSVPNYVRAVSDRTGLVAEPTVLAALRTALRYTLNCLYRVSSFLFEPAIYIYLFPVNFFGVLLFFSSILVHLDCLAEHFDEGVLVLLRLRYDLIL